MIKTFPLLVFILVGLLIGPTWGQATLNVPSASYPTIQSAINAAASDDTVLVGPGTYFENVVVAGPSIQIIGAGPGLSIIDGGGVANCVKVTGQTSMSYLVEGFTLQNGRGEAPFSGSVALHGGGILCTGALGAAEQTFRNCEITNCSGSHGTAVCVSSALRTYLENVEVHGCNAGLYPASIPAAVIWNEGGTSLLSLSNCRVHNNSADFVMTSTQNLNLEDCQIEMNTGVFAILSASGGGQSIRRTKIVGNTVTGFASSILGVVGNYVDFGDCLIANNVGGVFVLECTTSHGSQLDLSNTTIAGNLLLANPLGVIYTNATMGLVNMIIWGNVNAAGLTAPAVSSTPPLPVGLARQSIIENGTALGATVMSVDPLFVDTVNGDFRLLPTSPGIDSGVTSLTTLFYPAFPTLDIEGQPRVKGITVDLGCHESQAIASSPVAAGRVGQTSGGPFDVLMINGSAGGPFRTVQVPVGTASVVTLLQPPNVAAPVQFSIFGLLGRAELEYIYPVPFGIGDMCFAPAPLFPSYQAFLFTYASTLGPLNGVVPFLPASPTPWSSGVGPAIPFPLTLSFQGVIEESPGLFVPTNVIILEVN